jgi:flagellar hook-associated protein 2
MANGVLGLGSGQAAALNSDLIEKLKTAERKSAVAPIETNITKMITEKETFSSISKKVSELLTSIKPFDLFVSGGVTAFDQKTATTSGDSVTFDAADIIALKKGSTSVNVSQLAQKDVYQSKEITDKSTYNLTGTLSIATGSGIPVPYNFANYTSYDKLIEAINTQTGVDASLEEVSTGKYKLVLKSESSGENNKLTLSGTGSTTLGYDELNSSNELKNHVLTAQNMKATVDGIDYSVETNSITVDGLKITANKVDTKDSSGKFTSGSTINISEDNTQLETQMNSFITKYNELVALVDVEVQSTDSSLGDKSAIKSIVTAIKDKLFDSYGSDGKKSIFNFGIELDKYGGLSLDSTKFNKAIQDDKLGLKDLFAGTAEKKGLGTILKENLDSMTFTGGNLDIYEKSMLKREISLNTNKTTAEQLLDKKYELLSVQFAAYGTIINQMESSFSGLKMMIAQSTSGN